MACSSGIASVQVEVLREGEVVDTVNMAAPNFVNNAFVIKKGGPHAVRAVATDEAGQVSTNTCQADLDVQGGLPLFVGACFGKERLVHDHPIGDDATTFADGAVNYLFGKGFIGDGLTFWDIFEDDTRFLGLLVQGGFDLSPDGKWQIVGQARGPFSEFGDLENNYQLWGGIRFRPNSWK